MPYQCRHCGGVHCSDHRLPESHDCPALADWGDPDGVGVFDSGFDDSVDTGRGTGGFRERVTDTGGLLGYVRGNVAYTFLVLMVLTFLAQYVLAPLVGAQPASGSISPAEELWLSIFTLSSNHPEYVWTWVTSVFSHGGPGHLLANGIVIFFFGPLVERKIGSRAFAALFLGAGIVAGLGQIGIAFALGEVPAFVLGASGAALAIMAVLTVLNPGLRVYLYFLIPVPIWVITGGYAVISVLGIVGGGIPGLSGAGVANGAHLVGLLIGLAYGKYVEDQVSAPGQLQFGGRGGGPGRRRF